jgi:hypothetical protein
MSDLHSRPVPAAISLLRAEIEALPKDSGNKRKNIPPGLKLRVAELWLGSRMTLPDFARAISISQSSVYRWRDQWRKSKKSAGKSKSVAGFQMVSVVADHSPGRGGFTIEGPRGIRLTGLAVEDVAELWRALC